MKQTARKPAPGRRSARLHAAAEPSLGKKPDTKTALIETAEKLFGQHGLDGISLREIAVTAGQANSNVVQYHFGDKAGLIGAILEYRVAQLESLRDEMLQALSREPSQRTRELLKILWLPSMTIRGADGSHTFCRFLLQFLIHPFNVQHPLSKFYETASTRKASSAFSHVARATDLLRVSYARLPQDTLNFRMSALSMMFLSTVVAHDNAHLSKKNKKAATFDVEPVLDMAIAALAAPA